jgi:hypothetical protein
MHQTMLRSFGLDCAASLDFSFIGPRKLAAVSIYG